MSKLLILYISILFCFCFINLWFCKTDSVAQPYYKIGETAELIGTVSKGSYLSVIHNDEKEYFNTAYLLILDKPIKVLNKPYIPANISHLLKLK